ncbi:MAG: mannitol-1-phosphate 5-dehydrogenase [Spirochaetales bacterium]|nr:mannitol-1-phosphate 5-dehydrogenase [Spirochaetales bacterium]
MKKALLFGGGNIGRSFMVPVFQDAGYVLTIADIDGNLLDALERAGKYKITTCRDRGTEDRWVTGFRTLNLSDSEALHHSLLETDLVITSVGMRGAPAVCARVASVLEERWKSGGPGGFDIVMAENIPDAAEFFRTHMKKNLAPDFPDEKMPGLVAASIGKMVPLLRDEQRREDPLRLFAEEYSSLILDRDGFKNSIPESEYIKPVSPIEAYMDRKLYIHNMGHAAAAWLGRSRFPVRKMIWEVLEDKELRDDVSRAMMISGEALLREYPGVFSLEDIADHVNDLISRFRNRALGDTVQRVGRDLGRKLAPGDRLAGTLSLVRKHGLEEDLFLKIFEAALSFGNHFDADEADREISERYEKAGLWEMVEEYSLN